MSETLMLALSLDEWPDVLLWEHGHQDDESFQVGELQSGEPVLLLGPVNSWPGKYKYTFVQVLTRLGVGWLNLEEVTSIDC